MHRHRPFPQKGLFTWLALVTLYKTHSHIWPIAPDYTQNHTSMSDTKSIGSEEIIYTKQEELKLLRKVDWHVVPITVVFYLLSFLDRTNIGNARLSGLAKDLRLTDYDYRIALTILYVPYILAEIPSNLLVKKVGANIFLPTLVTLWGVCATLQGIVVNKEGLWAVRFFLGLTEAGILPGIILYLSSYYKPHELQFRIGLFWSASSLSGAFGGLLAAALGLIKAGGKNGWSWIFIVEGLITVTCGLIGFFVIPKNISSSKFLTSQEKVFLIQRLRNPNGHDEERELFTWSEAFSVFKSPHTWLLMPLSFCSGVSVYSLGYFTPTITAGLGYSVAVTQLLTVPFYTCSFVASIVTSIYSDRMKQRSPFIIGPSLVAIAGFAILYTCTRDDRGFGPRYVGLLVALTGVYSGIPSLLAWWSNVFANHYRRAVALGLCITFTNSGGLASVWLFRTKESPDYPVGYGVNMALTGLGILLSLALRFYFQSVNARRARSEKVVGDKELGDRADSFVYTL